MMCGKFEELWIPYLDDRLSAEQRGQVEAHLALCAECARRREEYGALFRTMEGWEAPPPSPWFDVRLRQRIAAEQPSRRLPAWLRIFSPAFPLAVSVMLLVAALLVWTGTRGPEPIQVADSDTIRVEELMHIVDELDMLDDFDMLAELNTADEEAGQAATQSR